MKATLDAASGGARAAPLTPAQPGEVRSLRERSPRRQERAASRSAPKPLLVNRVTPRAADVDATRGRAANAEVCGYGRRDARERTRRPLQRTLGATSQVLALSWSATNPSPRGHCASFVPVNRAQVERTVEIRTTAHSTGTPTASATVARSAGVAGRSAWAAAGIARLAATLTTARHVRVGDVRFGKQHRRQRSPGPAAPATLDC